MRTSSAALLVCFHHMMIAHVIGARLRLRTVQDAIQQRPRSRKQCRKYEDLWQCKQRSGKVLVCLRQNLGADGAATAANKAQTYRMYRQEQCTVIEAWATSSQAVDNEAKRAELQKKKARRQRQNAVALQKKKETCLSTLCKGNFAGSTLYKWFCSSSSGSSRCVCTTSDDRPEAARVASRNRGLQYKPNECEQIARMDRREEENRAVQANRAKANRAKRLEAKRRAEEEKVAERNRRKHAEGVLEVDWDQVVCTNEQDLNYQYNLECPRMSWGRTTRTWQIAGNQLHVQKWFCSFAGVCPEGKPCEGVCPCLEREANASAAASAALSYAQFPGKWTSCRRFKKHAGTGVKPAEKYRQKVEQQASSIASALAIIDQPSDALVIAKQIEKQCDDGLHALVLFDSSVEDSMSIDRHKNQSLSDSRTSRGSSKSRSLEVGDKQERYLRDIFHRCDQNRDGSVSKIDFIKALRVDGGVAAFFNLPQQIRQEDGSRTEMERIFQQMDTNSDKEVGWEEFLDFYARKSLDSASDTRILKSPKSKVDKIEKSKDILAGVRQLSIGMPTSSGELTDLLNSQADRLTEELGGLGPKLISDLKSSSNKVLVDQRIDTLSTEIQKSLEDARDAAERVELMNSVQPVVVVADMLDGTANKIENIQVLSDDESNDMSIVLGGLKKTVEIIQENSEIISDHAEDLSLSGESIVNIKSKTSSGIEQQIVALENLGRKVHERIVVPQLKEKEELLMLTDGNIEEVRQDVQLIEDTIEEVTDVYREVVASAHILKLTLEPDINDGITSLSVKPKNTPKIEIEQKDAVNPIVAVSKTYHGKAKIEKLPVETPRYEYNHVRVRRVIEARSSGGGNAPSGCPVSRHEMCEDVRRYLDESKRSEKYKYIVPSDTCDAMLADSMPGCFSCCGRAFAFVYLQQGQGYSPWCPSASSDKACDFFVGF